MDMFENRKIKGIHKSRYFASWLNAQDRFGCTEENKGLGPKWFGSWLRTLVIDGEHLTEDECDEITAYAYNGKMELEYNAGHYWRSSTDENGLLSY